MSYNGHVAIVSCQLKIRILRVAGSGDCPRTRRSATRLVEKRAAKGHGGRSGQRASSLGYFVNSTCICSVDLSKAN